MRPQRRSRANMTDESRRAPMPALLRLVYLTVVLAALLTQPGRYSHAGQGDELPSRTAAPDAVPVPRHLLFSVEESDATVGVYDSLSGREVSRIGLGYRK